MIKALLATSGVMALFLAPGIASAATVFTDRNLFQAAVGSLTTETLDNKIATATTITFDGGITATKSSDDVAATLNQVDFGTYTGFVVRNDLRNITFTFVAPIFAFGADFAFDNSLMVSGMFDSVNETVSILDTVGFFGLSSTSAFNQITFTTNFGPSFFPGGPPIGGELFYVDNLSVSSNAAVAPVPIPAALPLFAAGHSVMGFMGWRRKRKAALTN